MDKENFSRAPGNTKEVILRSPRSPKIPTTQNRSSSTALKNRILGVS